jgi:hypothetical protein
MKKLLGLGMLLVNVLSFSQTIVLSENCGDGSSVNNFQTEYPITFTGAFYVCQNYIPSDYKNASGEGQVFLGSYLLNGGLQYMTINNLDTDNNGINKLRFGVRINTYGYWYPNLIVEQSIDNINWSNINYIAPPANKWVNAITTTNLINSSTLFIRFRIVIDASHPNLNILLDDFIITKTENALANEEFNSNDELMIYPNPTKDIINIGNTDSQKEIKVFNMIGQQIMTKDITSKLDISNLDAGTYLIIIKDGDKIITKKIIKN